MTKQEIQEINQAISERGLQKRLKQRLRILRPSISADTIGRAWEVEDYDAATDTLQLVLRTAKQIKELDDERIRQEEILLEAQTPAA